MLEFSGVKQWVDMDVRRIPLGIDPWISKGSPDCPG